MSIATRSGVELCPSHEVSDWDRFVVEHRCGSVFHTRAMIDAYHQTPDYEPLALAAVDECGDILGLFVANRINTVGAWAGSFGARSVFFAEPLVLPGPSGRQAMELLLAEHDRLMHDQVVFSEIRPVHKCTQNRPLLEANGYQHYNYSNYEMPLRLPLSDMFQQLHGKRRNNIRANERRGLTLRAGCAQHDLQDFYDLLAVSFSRSRVPLVDIRHFEEIFRRLPVGTFRIAFADYEGRPVATACHLAYRQRVYCWFAGTERVPGIAAQSSLVWDGMQWAAKQGFEVYDFAGGGWEGENYGPGVFKSRFGARHINVGRYRKIYSTWRLKVAKMGYHLARPLFSHPSPPGHPR